MVQTYGESEEKMRWKKLPPGAKVSGATPVPTVKKSRSRMNKTEAAYAELLKLQQAAGQIGWWSFEPIKLRLARATFYTPDFMVRTTAYGNDGIWDFGLFLIEVKGFWRDDARVKIKVAAELFPIFQFVAVKRQGGGWEREEF